MSNVKQFDVRHSNDDGQNDLNIKLFDIGRPNVECQNDMNVKC